MIHYSQKQRKTNTKCKQNINNIKYIKRVPTYVDTPFLFNVQLYET